MLDGREVRSYAIILSWPIQEHDISVAIIALETLWTSCCYYYKLHMPKSNTIVIWTRVFEWYNMWLGVDLRTDSKMTHVWKIGLHARTYANHSRFHSQCDWRTYMTHLNADKILHFDHELDIHMSSKNYEANSYIHDLDLLILLPILSP